MNETHEGVLIVGGGIAGICAADALSERGVPVLLLERNATSHGGRIAAHPPVSFQHAGRSWTFSMEHGMHGWWRQYRNSLAVFERHGLSDRLVEAKDQAIIFDDGEQVLCVNVGRRSHQTRLPEPFHHLPLLIDRDIRRQLGLRDVPRILTLGLRVMESFAFDPARPERQLRFDGLSVQDYIDGIPPFFQAFLQSLARSMFFADPAEVSLWAFVISLRFYVFLRKDSQRFVYSRGPILETLFQPIIDAVERRGGALRGGVAVERVERREGGWRVHWRRADGTDAGWTEAPELLLAVDVEGARRLLASSPCLAPALGDLGTLRGKPSVTVRIWWTRDPRPEVADSGVFSGRPVSDNFFWLHRIQDEFRAWFAATGGGVSECHVYAPESVHALPDAELMDRVQTDLERAYPELRGSAVHRAIIRNPPTHIAFSLGCARAFPRASGDLPGLALCGDWIDGGQPVLYMERACQTALVAANALLRRRGLPEQPLLTPLPPPRHVRGLQRLVRGIDRLIPRSSRLRTQRSN